MKYKYKLGEGAFGCAIKGNISLSIDKENNHIYVHKEGEVTKLMTDEEEFHNEIRNTLIANKLDKGISSIQIYGYSILNKEDIHRIYKESREKIQECKIIMKSLYDIDEIYQIIYSKVGVILQDMYYVYPDIDFKTMIGLSYNLYRGLFIYAQHSFIHLDIKPNNIIYLSEEKNTIKQSKMVFIDYGLAGYNNEIKMYLLEKLQYIYTLPEIIAYNTINEYDLKFHIHKKTNIYPLFRLFKREYEQSSRFTFNLKDDIIKYLYNNNKEKYDMDLLILFKQIYHMYTQDRLMVKDMLRENIKYIDAYKLSYTMLELFKMYKYEDDSLFDEFIRMILSTAHIIPSKRTPISKLRNMYKTFMKKHKIKPAYY